ncbi:MAG: DUF4837 family protein [Gemmatimonadota bacterium]
MRLPRSLVRCRAPSGVAASCAALLLLAACGKPAAWGEENSLILIAADSLWEPLQDTTYAALEPTLFTVRDEKKFVVTHVDPASDQMEDLRIFKQVLVFATPDDPLLRKVAKRAGQEESLRVPSVFQATDVWARGQTVTAAVLDPREAAESWAVQLPAVLAMVESAFRERLRSRMFVTGPDTALARELSDSFGFSLVVPDVYRHVVRGDSLVVLRNDNPDPSQLIRSVLVTWREPPLERLDAEGAYAWREAVDDVEYNVPQGIDTARGSERRFVVDGHEILEATGVWSDEGGAVPAAGPFVDWLVQCPGRTYFLDAWLYAPNESKYEYLLQLREILDSFRCGAPVS